MPEPGRQITVQIDSLALNGFASFDADAFSSALSGELTRLVEQGAPLSGAWHVESVQISAAAPTNISTVGVQVARAIYGQIAAGNTTAGQTAGGRR